MTADQHEERLWAYILLGRSPHADLQAAYNTHGATDDVKRQVRKLAEIKAEQDKQRMVELIRRKRREEEWII